MVSDIRPKSYNNHPMRRVANQITFMLQLRELRHYNQVVVNQIDILLVAVIRHDPVLLQALPHPSPDFLMGRVVTLNPVRITALRMIGNDDVGDLLSFNVI